MELGDGPLSRPIAQPAHSVSTYSKIARPAASRDGKLVRWTSSFFSVPKKLSMGALSRQFPLRLIDCTSPCRARMAR